MALPVANQSALPTSGDNADSGALIRRLLALSWRYRRGCVVVLSLQIFQLALMLVGLSSVGLGIDVIHSTVRPGALGARWPFGWQPPVDWSPMQLILLVAGLILVMGIVRMLTNFLTTVCTADLVQRRIVVDLRSAVFEKLQRLSFRFFDANASGTIINRVTGDVLAVRMFVDGVVMPAIVLGISLLFYVSYMASIHVTLTFACLVTTPFIAWSAMRFSQVVKPAYRRNRELVDKMITRMAENIQGIAVVKAFAREDDEEARFAESNAQVRDQQDWIFRRISFFAPLVGFLTQINLGVLLIFGGWLVMQNELPLGAGLVVFASLLQQFSNQIGNLAGITNSMQQSLISARRVFEVLDAGVEIENKPDARQIGRAQGRLEFQDTEFDYHEISAGTVLRDINFSVEPGECIALLGATGSGKSALLSLIPRFYDPTGGRILLDGVDLRDIDINCLRRNVGIVFQESFLFSQSIADNIAFGHPEATREQIERAAHIASAHEFICELPNGYDSVIGESGADLSGGQRQRIAIARAILLEPSILLLDDPTAAIDSQTEADILLAMEQAMAGRTTFVVAHRLSTLRRANRVLVLEAGRVVECGAHADLILRDGPYARAAKLQIIDNEIAAGPEPAGNRGVQ